MTAITANPARVHQSMRPVNSPTGTLRKLTPSRRRSIMIAVPTKRHSVRTCVDSTRGQTQSDSSRATLQGVAPSHSRKLRINPGL